MRTRLSYSLVPTLTLLLAACDGGGTTGSGGSGGSTSSTSTTTSSTSSTSTGTGGNLPMWTAPQCTEVTGTAAVTFTKDEGKTLAPTKETLSGIGYTYGLVALDTANTLLAEHKGQILRSTDAGCTWASIGQVTDSPLTLVAAKGGIAYAFADNNKGFYRVEGTTITKLTPPTDNVLGVGVDPADAAHVRIGGTTGELHESKDSGATWTKLGTPAPVGSLPLVYRYTFDPKDLDHIVVGTASTGALVTTDAGATWTKATGTGKNQSNVFTSVISPADGKIVWAQGIDLDFTNTPVSEGRAIWRSEDGGKTFTKIVDQTADIVIRNQELLAAHPTDTKVLYFAFGTYFQQYGTDIYRYDHTTGMVTKTHNTYDDVSSIAFSPADPAIMYLGVTADKPPTP